MAPNFCWIEPNRLLASSFPADEASLGRLRGEGIAVLINLTDNRHDAEVLASLGLIEVQLPVPDFTAPSAETLGTAIETIARAHDAGHGVAVHCLGGLGRTGTVIAAWLVTRGFDADDAIARVRSLRPGSVETTSQERAVHEFAQRFASQEGRS